MPNDPRKAKEAMIKRFRESGESYASADRKASDSVRRVLRQQAEKKG